MRIKRRYHNTLNGYLNWVKDDFLRPEFRFDEYGDSAAQAMFKWETHGFALPSHTSEPDLLAKYVQGKTSRDFYVKNWRDDCKQENAVAEEFLYSLGLNEVEFKSVFGREPDPMVLFQLDMLPEFLRLTENTTDSVCRFIRHATAQAIIDGSQMHEMISEMDACVVANSW